MRWCAILCLELGIGLMLTVAGEDGRCSEINEQKSVDMNEIKGKWYLIESMEHTVRTSDGQTVASADTTSIGPSGTIIQKLATCPVIQLTPTEIEGNSRIRLLWEEQAGSLEYTFWISKLKGHGVWNSDIRQNGTIADRPEYRQFTGAAYVIKAVASNILLTFCSRNGPEFSLLLGRDHKLPKTDVRFAHTLLSVHRHLALFKIRQSCANGAATRSSSVSAIILVGLFGVFSLKRFVN